MRNFDKLLEEALDDLAESWASRNIGKIAAGGAMLAAGAGANSLYHKHKDKSETPATQKSAPTTKTSTSKDGHKWFDDDDTPPAKKPTKTPSKKPTPKPDDSGKHFVDE